MFDLNANVQEWRRNLEQGGSCRSADLDELESHLRDAVDQLRQQGLSAEEAFMVARRRLGDSTLLSHEFAKVNRGTIWRERAFWMASGVLALQALWILQQIIFSVGFFVLVHFIKPSVSGSAIFSVVSYLAATGLVVLLFFGCSRIFKRWFAVNSSTPARVAYELLVLIFVLALYIVRAFLYVPLPRYMGAQEYGTIAQGQAYSSLLGQILLAALLTAFVVHLYSRRTRQTE